MDLPADNYSIEWKSIVVFVAVVIVFHRMAWCGWSAHNESRLELPDQLN